MNSDRKPKFSHPALPLLSGLISAQIIATIQVYLSNLTLYTDLIIIEQAGYLAVPNRNVMPSLEELLPALCGGSFFTLSIGAGLALIAWSAAWIWSRIFFQIKQLKVFLILVWAGLLLWVNINGINFWGTLYCFLIPLIVFQTAVRLLPKPAQIHSNLRGLFHLLPIILMAILWMTQYDRHLFIDLRDQLLFSNPVGKKISDFYYRYTPYATGAFTSQNQKTLKTCRMPQLTDQSQIENLERSLLAMDYLPVDTDAPVDLEIVRADHHLLLKHEDRVIVKTTAGGIRSDLKHILNQFSVETDRFAVFRRLTFYGLLLGYPLILYILFHALFWLVIRIFADRQRAAAISSVICLIISICMFAAFLFSRSATIQKDMLEDAFKSGSWQERVAALRFIESQGLEIGRYNGYLKSLSSPKIPERYWLAKAMAKSKIGETHDALILLLNDPNVNVESMAFWALARRDDTGALPEILAALKVSDKWYSQIYAYNTLRTLGWKQTRSN